MSRIEHDTIPFEEDEKIWRLVKKYRLSPDALPSPPKPRPGSLPMDAPTKWEAVGSERPVKRRLEVAKTKAPPGLPPWATQPVDGPMPMTVDPDLPPLPPTPEPEQSEPPKKRRPWGRYIPPFEYLWVWHEGNAVALKFNPYDEEGVLHRVVIKWVPTKQKMKELRDEINRQLDDGSFTDLASLVEKIVPMPVDPSSMPQRRARRPKSNFKSLKEARKKLEKAGTGIRNEGFDAWFRRYVKSAKRPDEWTQAAVLYENYVKHVRRWGNNRHDKRLSELEMATETRFGIMLRETGVMKKRRRGGYYYPLQIKKGA